MKNIILITVISILAMSFMGCGEMGGKYADAKAVLVKMIEINDDYVKELDKVESAEDYVKAINKYSDAMKQLKPKMEAVAKKYPEMKNQDTPQELKPLVEKMGQSMQGIFAASMKMMKYAEDPDVQKATQRLQTAMGGMAGRADKKEPSPPQETPTEPAEPTKPEETPTEETPTAETPAPEPVEESTPAEEPAEPETSETVETAETADESPSAAPAPETPAPSAKPPESPVETPVETAKETPAVPERAQKPAAPKPAPPPPPPPANTVVVVTTGGSEKLETLGFYTEAAFPGVFKDKFQLVEGGSPAYHLVIDAKSMGSSKLSHYGSTTTQFSLNIRMKMVKVKTGKIVAGPFSRTVKYTQLNEEDNLKEGIRILLSKVVSGIKK